MILLKDQTVGTPYGPGKVVAFERFDGSTGRSLEPSEHDVLGSNSRVIVQLDTPTNWPCHSFGNPYLARQHLTVLE